MNQNALFIWAGGLLLFGLYELWKKRGNAQPQGQNASQGRSPPPPTSSSQGRSPPPTTSYPNLAFYRNEIPSEPNGDYIEKILNSWRGNYSWLEDNPDYIQWLFPNKKPGMNNRASTLHDREAKAIRRTPELRNRVKKAFVMMLDYYGMRLDENDQFQLSHNYVERLRELNQRDSQNFLRITRILLALKELGHKHLMLPWMKFLSDLIYQTGDLSQARRSFESYWSDTLDYADQTNLKGYLYNKGFAL